jgi:hypothetical protein
MIRASHFYFLTGCRNSHQWRLVGFVWRDRPPVHRHRTSSGRSMAGRISSLQIPRRHEHIFDVKDRGILRQHSVERNLLLVLNRIKQLSQVNSCFSQLRMNPGDFRGNMPAWKLYLDSFNAAVFFEFRRPELNAIVGTDRYGL